MEKSGKQFEMSTNKYRIINSVSARNCDSPRYMYIRSYRIDGVFYWKILKLVNNSSSQNKGNHYLLLGVWKSEETLFLVFDLLLLQSYETEWRVFIIFTGCVFFVISLCGKIIKINNKI